MRFSHAHVPAAPPRRFWMMVAGFFLLLAVPVVLINLAVDPFDFRVAPHARLVRSAIMPANNTALWMAGELGRIPRPVLDGVTIVFAGDSRTDSLVLWRTTLRVMRVRRDRVLNLSFGGASLDDTLRLVETELPRLPELRAVVLGVSYENIGNQSPDRIESALRLHAEPWRYALNLGTFASSLQLLVAQAGAVRAGASSDEIASLERIPGVPPWMLERALESPPEVENSPRLTESELRTRVARWIPSFVAVDPALVRQKIHDQIAPFVARLRERGIQVVFFIPPLRHEVLAGLGAEGKNAMRDFAMELAKFSPVEDYTAGDRDGIPFRYRDHAHVEAGVARAMFAHIYRRHFLEQSGAPR